MGMGKSIKLDAVDIANAVNKVLLEVVAATAKVIYDHEKIKHIEQRTALELFDFLRALLKGLGLPGVKEMYCEHHPLFPHVIVIENGVLSLKRNWLDLVEIAEDNIKVIEEWKCREKSNEKS
jgi:hypothetical protein